MKVKKKKQRDRQILESYQRPEKAVLHKGDGETGNSWRTRNSSQGLGK